MSRQFSIFTKGIALLLVLAIFMTFTQEALAYHCADEEDDHSDALVLLGILAAAALAACSPPSLATGWGALGCAAAYAAFLYQRSEAEEAWHALQACEREHEPN